MFSQHSVFVVGGIKLYAVAGGPSAEPDPRNATDPSVLVFGYEEGGRAHLLVDVSASLRGKVHAGDLIGVIAKHVDGFGGGRHCRAQCGGSNPEGIQRALTAAVGALAAQLGVLPPSEPERVINITVTIGDMLIKRAPRSSTAATSPVTGLP